MPRLMQMNIIGGGSTLFVQCYFYNKRNVTENEFNFTTV